MNTDGTYENGAWRGPYGDDDHKKQQCHEDDCGQPVNCEVTIPFCCRVQIPTGFHSVVAPKPNLCFDSSELKCVKVPVTFSSECLQECLEECLRRCLPETPPYVFPDHDMIAGYELRLMGSLNVLTNVGVAPIRPLTCPKTGPCVACCSKTVAVDVPLIFTSSPAPCEDLDCVRIKSCQVKSSLKNDSCGEYYEVEGQINLVCTGNCL